MTTEEKKVAQTVLVLVRERPARKVVLIRARTAVEYFAFCEEAGCDAWQKLCAITGALHEPVGMWMPRALRPAGTSLYTQGVEVAADYAGFVPEKFELLELPPCTYLFFQGQPYPEPDFGEPIRIVQEAMARFDPGLYGFDWDDEVAPRIQLAPVGARGYIEGRPVRKIPATTAIAAF